ncbi:MAG TPA: hypothetical protein VLT33_03805 [Labilithrix sp.]|nr:hypothetical protein [Labilithrix sp.]
MLERRSLAGIAALTLALTVTTAARADEAPLPPPPPAAALSQAEMQASVRAYYGTELTTGLLFMAYGAVTAGAGGAVLTEGGDFAKGLGASSLILGGSTFLGGIGYAVAVKIRGGYFTHLVDTDPAAFQREESERIAGTTSRFWLYLGSELLETAAGIGIAAYGMAAKDDLYKGIGIGAALQGIGLFVIDTPGAGRAARYRSDVERFRPSVSASVGGGTRPWALTLSQAF